MGFHTLMKLSNHYSFTLEHLHHTKKSPVPLSTLLSPRQPLNTLYLCGSVYFGQFTESLVFCDYSLSVMFSRYSCYSTYEYLIPLMALLAKYSTVSICHILFVHSLADGHLDCSIFWLACSFLSHFFSLWIF